MYEPRRLVGCHIEPIGNVLRARRTLYKKKQKQKRIARLASRFSSSSKPNRWRKNCCSGIASILSSCISTRDALLDRARVFVVVVDADDRLVAVAGDDNDDGDGEEDGDDDIEIGSVAVAVAVNAVVVVFAVDAVVVVVVAVGKREKKSLKVRCIFVDQKRTIFMSNKRTRTTTTNNDRRVDEYAGYTVNGDGDEIAVVDVTTIDSARFMRDFVTTRRPCVLRGLLDLPAFSALRRWTELEYLRARAGNTTVRVETRASTHDSYGVGRERQMKVGVAMDEFSRRGWD